MPWGARTASSGGCVAYHQVIHFYIEGAALRGKQQAQ